MNNKTTSQKIAFMGVLLALTIVLNLVENMVPPITALPLGVKLGLSNVVIMYCLFFIDYKKALLLAILKSVFVFITRGFTASVLSLSGGLSSVIIMIVILYMSKKKASYLITSVIGAVFHNLGQITVATLILETNFFLYYFPILLVSGVIFGVITSVVLRVVMPYVRKVIR